MLLPNPLSPDQMSADERLAEVSEILARGILRLRARHRATPPPLSRDCGEICLDFTPEQSGHAVDDTSTENRLG